jgi:hypothetical protein
VTPYKKGIGFSPEYSIIEQLTTDTTVTFTTQAGRSSSPPSDGNNRSLFIKTLPYAMVRIEREMGIASLEEAITDSCGNILFLVEEGSYLVKTTKEGYQPASSSVKIDDTAYDLEILLEPEEKPVSQILSTMLYPSFPNPANDACYIPFELSVDSNVTVDIYNILGQKVRRIEAGQKKAGSYTKQDKALFWNLTNDKGEKVAKGLYYIRLKAGGFTATKAMVVR